MRGGCRGLGTASEWAHQGPEPGLEEPTWRSPEWRKPGREGGWVGAGLCDAGFAVPPQCPLQKLKLPGETGPLSGGKGLQKAG